MSIDNMQELDGKSKISVLEDENKALKLDIEAKEALLREITGKHEHLVNQLKDKVECPVCLEIPQNGPAPVCPNGHLVCQNCKTDTCPTCRTAMGNNKSLLATVVIENIEHECKFEDCGEIFTIEKLWKHQKVCQHRTVTCPYEMCQRKIGLAKLRGHLDSGCSYDVLAKVIEDSNQGFTSITYTGAEEGERDWCWQPSMFSFRDVKFVVFPVKNDNFYFFVMVMFELEEECSKYGLEIVVHEEGTTATDSEVSYKFCGQPTSIDEEDVKYLGLTVSDSGMRKLLKKGQNKDFILSFKFSDLQS